MTTLVGIKKEQVLSNKKQKHIGLVVPAKFRFSETFFIDDCKTWEKMGHRVTIFPLQTNQQGDAIKGLNYLNPPTSLSDNDFIKIIQLLKAFPGWMLNRSFKNFLKFFLLEWQEKKPVKTILSRVYTNVHILSRINLDYIAFGFGNLAFTRENIADAINAKMILLFQGSDIKIWPLIYGKGFYAHAFTKSDKIIFKSRHLYAITKNSLTVKQDDAKIIYNKIDTSKFPAKQETGTLNSPLNLIAIGRLHWIKGFNHLIKGMYYLKSKKTPFRLKIIGEGEEYEHLFYLAMTHDLLENIQFEGVYSQDKLQKELAHSDILLNSSFSESSNRALLEGQATGVLCISTHWEGAEEILKDGKTGWLVPKRAPEALANKIIEVQKLPFEKRSQVANNAIQNIQENFNLDTLPKDYQAILTD